MASHYFPCPGADHLLPVMEGESCGYEVNPVNNILTIPFTGCNVKQVGHGSLSLDSVMCSTKA